MNSGPRSLLTLSSGRRNPTGKDAVTAISTSASVWICQRIVANVGFGVGGMREDRNGVHAAFTLSNGARSRSDKLTARQLVGPG